MTESLTPAAAEAERSIVLERVFDAPRALVFQAWTNPAHLPRWFGPRGFSCETHAIDVREGGAWHFDMLGPDGTVYPNFMRFTSIRENEAIVYEHGTHPGQPPKFIGTVTFADEGLGTRMRMTNRFPTAEAAEAVKGFGAVELGHQTLSKLAERLAETTLRLTRVFDAPRELVYRAWTEPERFAQWWGPKGMRLEAVKQDIRPGGVFHYRLFDGRGAEMWAKFVYLELREPDRIVFTNSFSDAEGNLGRAPFAPAFPPTVYNVVTLEAQGDKTLLTLSGGPLDATEAELAFYQGMHASMQQGFAGTWENLDAYLAGAV